MSNRIEHVEDDDEIDDEAEFLRQYENSCQLDEFGQMFYHIFSRLRTFPKLNEYKQHELIQIGNKKNENIDIILNSEENAISVENKCDLLISQNKTDEKSNQEQSIDALRPMCRFHVLGKCRFGESCTFSHNLSSFYNQNTSINPYIYKTSSVVCPYFVRGHCRYENRCHLSHDPNDIKNQRDEKNSEYACGICFEDIITTGKRFGLMTCDHCFCLDCIRQWRRSKSLQTNVTRSCPACRQITDFVVPSRTFYTGKEKSRIIEAYKNELSVKPCKYFNGKIGSCFLGLHCFYAHLHDGKDMKQVEKKIMNRRKKDIDIVYRLIEELNLFDNGF